MKTLLSILLLAFAAAHALYAVEKPNIIVILSDDVSYSDIGCFGGEIETPQWEAWAKRVGVQPWPLGGGEAKK